jgi:hypothetical protein
MANAHYNPEQSLAGGIGAFTLLSLAAGGVTSAVSRLSAVRSVIDTVKDRLNSAYSSVKAATRLTHYVGIVAPQLASLSAAAVPRSVFERLRKPFETIPTVTGRMRDDVLDAAPLKNGKLAYIDPMTNQLKAFEEGERIAIDHVVPVNKMLDPAVVPGANKLTREEMEMLIHDEEGFGNLVALPSNLNSSKQDKLYDWNTFKGKPLDPVYRQNLIDAQAQIVEKMQKWVAQTVKGRK